MMYLTKINILNNRQFGFRSGLNTFDAINTFTSDLYSALNKYKSIISVFIDFSKAFDSPTKYYPRKIVFLWYPRVYNDWSRSYLTNRHQYTTFNNTSSTTKPICLRVPQASILEPILFLLYMSDIVNISDSLLTILFADDSTFYMIGNNPTELNYKPNTEL